VEQEWPETAPNERAAQRNGNAHCMARYFIRRRSLATPASAARFAVKAFSGTQVADLNPANDAGDTRTSIPHFRR